MLAEHSNSKARSIDGLTAKAANLSAAKRRSTGKL